MRENKSKVSSTLAAAILGLIILVSVSLGTFFWLSTTRIPQVILPNPNGYDRFVEASAGISETPHIAEASVEELGQFVRKHERALRHIREALRFESCVPIEYARGFLQQELDRLGPLKQSGKLLLVAGRLAEEQGRINEAADTYLDVVRLSRAVSRGGLMVHLLLGAGSEEAAWNALLRIEADMDNDEKAQFLTKHKSILVPREPLDAVMNRERMLSRATHGWWIHRMGSFQFNDVRDLMAKTELKLSQLEDAVLDAMRAP